VELGGFWVLELRGKYTSVTAAHLMEENDTPRESKFRKRGREVNEVSPVLKGWESMAEESSSLIHLVLVHGVRARSSLTCARTRTGQSGGLQAAFAEHQVDANVGAGALSSSR